MAKRVRVRPEATLLGGAKRGRVRARGFIDWTPTGNTLELLGQVQGVLDEYADHLPLTIRQIYYRLVAVHAYEKTTQSYWRLCAHLSNARRARLIPMDAIRDDGGVTMRPFCWASPQHFMRNVRQDAADLVLDRTAGQVSQQVVCCEAVGMAPQLSKISEPFGVPVVSSGGFDSLTEKFRFASELTDEDRPTEVLHIGDHDPSGAHMFLAFSEDVQAFARELGREVSFTRLAVTPEQIRQYRLPTAPVKPTDRRAFKGQTCQAEALAPDVLANILTQAIGRRIDQRAYDHVLRRERQARRDLIARLR